MAKCARSQIAREDSKKGRARPGRVVDRKPTIERPTAGARHVSIIATKRTVDNDWSFEAQPWDVAFEGYASAEDVRSKALHLLRRYARVRVLTCDGVVAEFPQGPELVCPLVSGGLPGLGKRR